VRLIGNHREKTAVVNSSVTMKEGASVKKMIISAVAALAVSAIAYAGQPAKAAPAASSADPVVIKYGNTEVHQSEFEAALKALPAEYQAYASGPGKRAFADDFVRMRMLAQAAEKSGVANTPDVQAQIKLMRDNALANAELTQMESSLKISDDDLKKLYDEKKSSFETVKARHILIAPSTSPAAQAERPKLTDEQAKAKAGEIRKKLVAGADFAEMAKKESDDVGSGQRGGDLGSFHKGQMVAEFDQAAFALKAGEISPVVKTEYGYHILQVQEHSTQPLDQVKEQLETQAKHETMQKQLDAMKTSANVTLDDNYFKPATPPVPVPVAPKAEEKPAPTPKKK
jgi:peptidyl-prolyl cis-trans isomerase C